MEKFKDLSTNELVSLAREHDEDAFCELVLRFTPMINRVISSFSNPALTGDELFSEGCVALHSAVMSYDLGQDKVTFGLYARVCVYNAAVDCIRQASVKDVSTDDDISAVPDATSLENSVANKESVEFLLKSAQRMLSDYEYQVLTYHIRGYRTADIAKRLMRSAKSVDNAKSRIFKRLRDAFGEISDI